MGGLVVARTVTRTLARTVARRVAPGPVRRRLVPGRRTLRGRSYLVAILAAVILALFAGFMLLSGILALFVPMGTGEQDDAASCGGTSLAGAVGVGSSAAGGAGAERIGQLKPDQIANAKTIIGVGKALHVPAYGWVIALATASQESGIRNLPYGDRDSLGLFQQRASWGSTAERLDPATSSRMFYTGGRGGQKGLLDIKGWQQMPVTVAAQAVQGSKFPLAYADDEPLARELVQAYGGVTLAGGCGAPPATQCPDTPWPAVERGLTPDALDVLRCTHQQFPEFKTFYGRGQRPAGGDGDHAAGRAVDMMIPYADYRAPDATDFGWKVAHWLQANHQRLGIKYIIYDVQIWSVRRSSEGWRPYRNYTGCTTDTCLHRDHVHVSVYGNAASLPATGDWTLPERVGSYQLGNGFRACAGASSSNCHPGLDFVGRVGSPVFAAGAGTVVRAERGGGPYGTFVEVDHGHGVVTYYANLSSYAPHLVGTKVEPGMMLGSQGDSGSSSGSGSGSGGDETAGPHLHFEVRVNGTPVDPTPWLQDHGVRP